MNKTEQNLNDAFERIKNGNTINIAKNRKLSYSSVEDEAKVSRSLLRSYPDLFEKVKEQILLNKIQNDAQKPNINKKQNKLKEILEIEKKKNKDLNLKLDNLLKANIGLVERIRYLENELRAKK